MTQLVPVWIFRIIVWLSVRWPRLADFLSNQAVQAAVAQARRRPHPWSTISPYVSWPSLTNQRWSARHLPPASLKVQPPKEKITELFAALAEGQENCKKSTLLFPAFAQYLTDGFIRTVMPNESAGEPEELRKQNTSNHQIDMCPLYGRNERQTRALRTFGLEGRRKGTLKSQMRGTEEFAPFLYEGTTPKQEFADLDPVLGIDKVMAEQKPFLFAFGGDRANANPQVALLNTLFLREHNRLAGLIDDANPDWSDDQVFEVARNVVIVLFIKIVVQEYIRHIAPTPFGIFASPVAAWTAPWNKPNWITVEFSLLYRWHSLIPARIRWGAQDYPIEHTIFNNMPLLEAGLKQAFLDLSSQSATRLGAFNTASPLVDMEMRAMGHGRVCELDTYAAYREYMSLSKPDTFEDISSNPQVVAKLRELYETPDQVEFYVGLFCEDTVRNSPLPELLLRFVAVDAFSQALTNPLLSEHVYKEETFSNPGWAAIQDTKSIADIVTRNSAGDPPSAGSISMTKPDWSYEWPLSALGEALAEAKSMIASSERVSRLTGFFVSTVGEVAGLIMWLYYVSLDRGTTGLFWLVGGEAIEWGLLAYLLIKSPASRPRRDGRIARGLVLTGLISLSEAVLWVIWLQLTAYVGLIASTVVLTVAMHLKHDAEMSVFTGRPVFGSLLEKRDMAASAFEGIGAGVWMALAMNGHPIMGAFVLLACISVEHLLQFKTAGFMK